MSIKDVIKLTQDKMISTEDLVQSYPNEDQDDLIKFLNVAIQAQPPQIMSKINSTFYYSNTPPIFSASMSMNGMGMPTMHPAIVSPQDEKMVDLVRENKTLQQKLDDAESERMNLAVLWGKEKEENERLKKIIERLSHPMIEKE